MNQPFDKQSVFTGVSDEMINAVGKAMLAFAAIDGFLNYVLYSNPRSQVNPGMEKLARQSVTKRLDLLKELLKNTSACENADLLRAIAKTKDLFKKRNLVAHSPLVTNGECTDSFIHNLWSTGQEQRLFASDILNLALEADLAYDEIRQLYFAYLLSKFNAGK